MSLVLAGQITFSLRSRFVVLSLVLDGQIALSLRSRFVVLSLVLAGQIAFSLRSRFEFLSLVLAGWLVSAHSLFAFPFLSNWPNHSRGSSVTGLLVKMLHRVDRVGVTSAASAVAHILFSSSG